MTTALPTPITTVPAAIDLSGAPGHRASPEKSIDVRQGPQRRTRGEAKPELQADFLALLAAVVQSTSIEPPRLLLGTDASMPRRLNAKGDVDSIRLASSSLSNRQHSINLPANGRWSAEPTVTLPLTFSPSAIANPSRAPRFSPPPQPPGLGRMPISDLGRSDNRDSIQPPMDSHQALAALEGETFPASVVPPGQTTRPTLNSSSRVTHAPAPPNSAPAVSSYTERDLIVTAAGKKQIEVSLKTPHIGPVWLQVREGHDGIQARLETHADATMRILQLALDSIRDRIEAGGIEIGDLSLGFRHEENQREHPRWMAQPAWPDASTHGAVGQEEERARSRIQSLWRGQVNVLA